MYVEKKKIGNKEYNYLRTSVRIGNTVRSKTLAYLGAGNLTKSQLKKKIAKITKIASNKIQGAKFELRQNAANELDKLNEEFLSKEQLSKITEIKRDFAKKLKQVDKRVIEDMFRDFKTFYIYNTNSIEGNTLTLEETNMLLNEGKTPEGKELREIYDHINEKETFDLLLKEKPEITSELIINIHAMLLKNVDNRVGNFRDGNVRVAGAAFDTTDARYVLTDIRLLMKWYEANKKTIHPLIFAAIFHEKFERIHPFFDGNGRTGRTLINLILLRANLPPLIVKNKERKEYYHVLNLGHKAALTKTEPEHYKPIVEFCYQKLLETYQEIFAKWG